MWYIEIITMDKYKVYIYEVYVIPVMIKINLIWHHIYNVCQCT